MVQACRKSLVFTMMTGDLSEKLPRFCQVAPGFLVFSSPCWGGVYKYYYIIVFFSLQLWQGWHPAQLRNVVILEEVNGGWLMADGWCWKASFWVQLWSPAAEASILARPPTPLLPCLLPPGQPRELTPLPPSASTPFHPRPGKVFFFFSCTANTSAANGPFHPSLPPPPSQRPSPAAASAAIHTLKGRNFYSLSLVCSFHCPPPNSYFFHVSGSCLTCKHCVHTIQTVRELTEK